MSTFCPYCGNLLLIEGGSCLRFFCSSCPFVFPITRELSHKLPLTRKVVDHILSEDDWKSAQKTDMGIKKKKKKMKANILVTCEKCNNRGAYFMQLQIRSADEPMTTFYKCTNFSCGFQWREG